METSTLDMHSCFKRFNHHYLLFSLLLPLLPPSPSLTPSFLKTEFHACQAGLKLLHVR